MERRRRQQEPIGIHHRFMCVFALLMASLGCWTSRLDGADGATVPAPGEFALNHSYVYMFVGKVGLGHEHGVMGKLSAGKLRLGARESAGRIVFDMQSFTADTDQARKYVGLSGTTSAGTREQVNTNMLGAKVLHVSQFPTATFDIDSAPCVSGPVDGKSVYELNGNLTLHGTTRPLRIKAEVTPDKNGYLHVRCGFVLSQSEFGITPFTKALGAIGVADELKVYGDAWLRPETPLATQPAAATSVVR